MARFSSLLNLATVLALLAVAAHARPAPADGGVAGVPGLDNLFAKEDAPSREATKDTDKKHEELNSVDKVQSLADEIIAEAQASEASSSARATPDVPTPSSGSTKASSVPSASPSSKPSESPDNPLQNVPLIGGLVNGLLA